MDEFADAVHLVVANEEPGAADAAAARIEDGLAAKSLLPLGVGAPLTEVADEARQALEAFAGRPGPRS